MPWPAALPAPAPAPPALAPAPPSQDASAKPSTAIALPQTSIGACSVAASWLPLRTPTLYPVVQLSAPPADSVAQAPPVQDASANPYRLIALPQALIGAWTVASSWLPLSAPALLPVSQSACAAPPVTSRKPAESTPTLSDLRTHVFMIGKRPSTLIVFSSAGERAAGCRHA